MNDLEQWFQKPAGRLVRGGCNSCRAYNELLQSESGEWIVEYLHDADCPIYVASISPVVRPAVKGRSAQDSYRRKSPAPAPTSGSGGAA